MVPLPIGWGGHRELYALQKAAENCGTNGGLWGIGFYDHTAQRRRPVWEKLRDQRGKWRLGCS